MRVLLLLIFLMAAPAWAACEKCNVILISLDTVGIAPLGMYGAKPSATPNMDAFAKKSRVYLNAYTPSPWTLPAHAAMVTGHYPWVMRVNGTSDKIPEQYPTLAEILKDQGYQTIGITDGVFVDEAHGFNRGFDKFEVLRANFFVAKTRQMGITIPKVVSAIKNRSKQKPFFLFYHTYDAHEPLLPSAQSVKTLAPAATKMKADLGEIAELLKRTTPVSADLARDLKMLYAAGVMDVDRDLAPIFQVLEQQGLLHNTIVIITSDHGQEMGEHGSWALHGFQLYDEVMRVPLIVHMPGAPAKNLTAPVSLVDIVPSVLAWTGVKTPHKFMGQRLPEINSDKDSERAILGYSTAVKKQMTQFATTLPGVKASKAERDAAIRDPLANKPQALRRMVLVNNKKFIFDVLGRKQTVFDMTKDPKEQDEQAVTCRDPLCIAQAKWIFDGGF